MVCGFRALRRHLQRASESREALFNKQLAVVERRDVELAWMTPRRLDNKVWSLRDCVSRARMQRWGVATALAFDDHFRQFGIVAIVP
jgi:predicted nucleic acid-binding protein